MRPRSPRRRRLGRLLGALVSVTSLALAFTTWVGPARAALVAVGVDDQLNATHDRTANVAAPGVLANDTGLLGGTTAILVSDVSHGTLSLQSNGGFSYRPEPGFVGSDTFRYKPSGLLSAAANVSITVTNVAPVATADTYSVPDTSTLQVAAPGLLANDADADDDVLSVVLVAGPANGSLNLYPDGGFVYQPGGFVGTATFSYRASDGLTSSASVMVRLIVTAHSTPNPTPSSKPIPTPTPTPTSTARPTQPPASVAASPSPRPSAGQAPASARPTASTPVPPPGAGGGSGGTGSGTAATGAAGSGRPGPSPASGGYWTTSGSAGQAEGITIDQEGILGFGQLWFVPAGVVAGPGLLVLLWVALQSGAGAIWLPAARRFRGDDPQRSNGGTSSSRRT
jgi:hypothetical protein